MRINLRAEKASGIIEMSPATRKWLKRFLLMLLVSAVLSQSPYLLIAVQSWLLGHWGVFGKAGRRLVALRIKRREWVARPNSPAEA